MCHGFGGTHWHGTQDLPLKRTALWEGCPCSAARNLRPERVKVLDLEKNDGSVARPHYMGSSLRRILRKRRRRRKER
ncbi:hypothetical protein COCON_G00089260 [Conger conger]|uniref:Uncharacterized protein n=1 Tax=Conger conger TaxID=82655 RepID=A0A9Q1DL26_CONCO|nr:hypothetical protein COCON_G00089260 [Conger conger]